MANGRLQGKIPYVELESGTMVTAHVRLTEPLGEGAMGAVWVAEHLTLHTEVAVKFISDQLARDNPEIIARFEREASVAAQIKSPYVVQTFDHGVMEDGTPYIVMELLEGESLEQRIQRVGPLPLDETAQIISQVARALRRAHEKGIVHRDIKPDNIFVTMQDDGVFCKILDFGIAKQAQLPKMGRLTNPGIMIGTPEYMSPEQVLSAKDVDFQTDLWALAVTAYEALTARLPFEAEALGELCLKLLNGKFEDPSQYRPELAPTVDEWFALALNRKIEERFSGARELSTSFIHALELSPASALLHTHPGASSPGLMANYSQPISEPEPSSSDVLQPRSSRPTQPGSSRATQTGSAKTTQAGSEEKSATLSGTFATVDDDRKPKWKQPVWIAAGVLGSAALIAFSVMLSSNGDLKDDNTSATHSATPEPKVSKPKVSKPKVRIGTASTSSASLTVPAKSTTIATSKTKDAPPKPLGASSAQAAASASAKAKAKAKTNPAPKPRFNPRAKPRKPTKRQDHGF